MWCDYKEVKQKLFPDIGKVQSIKEAFEITASLGEKTYLIDAISGKEYSYEGSNREINLVANSLIYLGLKKGDRVGVYMGNSPRCVFTILGIFKAGMIVVPINFNFTEREIEHIIKTAGISTVIMDPNPTFLDNVLGISEVNDSLRRIVVYGQRSLSGKSKAEFVCIEDFMEKVNDDDPRVKVNGGDTCVIFFTSGTTGMPKGAPITNKLFLLAAQSVLAIPWTDNKSRNYTCLPLFHANAQLYSVMAMRCLGTSLVLSDRFSPKKFFQEITRYQATYFNSIGGMMQILAAAFEKDPVPRHTAKYVFAGGTPIELWQRFEKKFGVIIFEGYSQSESPVLFLNANPDPTKRKIGSFGIPVFPDLGRRTKILMGKGKDAPEGEEMIGELLQMGLNMRGYWGEEQKTREVFTEGWLHSGDLVRRDQDGYFYFVDRLKFMIRKGGENIAAFEIEDVVNRHPDVSESTAIPVPDPLREEEIKVFIKAVEGRKINFPDLLHHCTKKLSYFKIPRYLELIEDFPKTATERIQKMRLKESESEKSDHGWDRDKEIPDWRKRFYEK
jgi:crotonobetaine/carnitine-CoA ligase